MVLMEHLVFDNSCENDRRDALVCFTCRSQCHLGIAKSSNNCKGATLYVTLSPCKDCSKLIFGRDEVVYQNSYKDTSGLEFLRGSDIELLQISEIAEE